MPDAEPSEQPAAAEGRTDPGEDYGAKAVEDRNPPQKQDEQHGDREPEDPEAD